MLERDGHDGVCVHHYWPFNLQAFLWPLNPTALSTGSGSGWCHQNNRRGPPEPLPICTPTCLAYQAAYQGKHYCCYVLTHLHVATNKRRRLLEQALFCSSAARHKNLTLLLNHYIHTHCPPHPVSIIEHGLIRSIQCPRIDPPMSAGETEPLAVKVYERQGNQAAGA